MSTRRTNAELTLDRNLAVALVAEIQAEHHGAAVSRATLNLHGVNDRDLKALVHEGRLLRADTAENRHGCAPHAYYRTPEEGPMSHPKINATVFTELLAEALLESEFSPLLLDAIENAEDFQSAGYLGANDGLVVRLDDGSEFQISIVQSRPAR
jgi:hypothetical protein